MGYFEKTKCPICGTEIGPLGRSPGKYNEEYICNRCYFPLYITNKLERIENITPGEARELVEEARNDMASGNIPREKTADSKDIKKVGRYFEVDLKNKTWRIPGFFKSKQMTPVSMILDYELLEDGTSITKGGASIGRAAVGGVLFGPAGLLIGGVTGKRKQKNFCTTMQIKLTLNDPHNPTAYIKFITAKTKKTGMIYKTACKSAQEILSLLNVITNAPEPTETKVTTSTADEIKKFKDLLDSGAITKEEFEAQKKKLLDL